MSKFKGTKGKWHEIVGGFSMKSGNPNLIQIYATNDDLEMVCKVYKDNILHNKTQNFRANARLISKAPELLNALSNIVEHFELIAIPDDARKLIDDAESVIDDVSEIN